MTRVSKPPPPASLRARLDAVRVRLTRVRSERGASRLHAERRRLLAERDALIEGDGTRANRGCLSVPWFLANRFRSCNPLLDRDDLAAAGNVGLVEAAELFDPTRGVAFSTYAYHAVWARITLEAKRQARRIRVPDNWLQDKAELTDTQDAQLEKASTILSLDWRDRDDKAFQVAAPVAVGPEPDERAALQAALHRLPARDREIVLMRSGGLSLLEVGRRLGICRERVRQIEVRAHAKLRAWLAPRYGRVG